MLSMARAAVACLAYRRVVAMLSLRDHQGGDNSVAELHELIARVRWAVATVERHRPRMSTCLTRAIAVKLMLRRRGVASTLALGLRRAGEGISAHAWLSADQRVILGGDAAGYVMVWTSNGGPV